MLSRKLSSKDLFRFADHVAQDLRRLQICISDQCCNKTGEPENFPGIRNPLWRVRIFFGPIKFFGENIFLGGRPKMMNRCSIFGIRDVRCWTGFGFGQTGTESLNCWWSSTALAQLLPCCASPGNAHLNSEGGSIGTVDLLVLTG